MAGGTRTSKRLLQRDASGSRVGTDVAPLARIMKSLRLIDEVAIGCPPMRANRLVRDDGRLAHLDLCYRRKAVCCW